ncbi:MAG TPA: superoxide dismutase family protein [Candidatus Thermoplasmatota archaeon]
MLSSTGAQGATAGWANFTEDGGKLTIHIELRGVPAGEHGAHIHQNGACGTSTANGTTTVGGAAGGHFNPAGAKHPQHAGDLGNINVQSGGTGTLTFTSDDLTLKEGDAMSVVGRSVVIHAGKDDLQSDPAGNSGARLLCGVIMKA